MEIKNQKQMEDIYWRLKIFKMSYAESRFKHCFGDLSEDEQKHIRLIIKTIERKTNLNELQSTLTY